MKSENKPIVSKLPYAIFHYKGEYAVASMGVSRPFGDEKFQQSWVVNTVARTLDSAVEAMDKLIHEAKVREAQVLADIRALARNR